MLRPELPGLVDAVIAAIGSEVPEYSGPLEGTFGHNLRTGVHTALGRFLDMLEDPHRDDPEGRRIVLELGRGEARAGRSLDALQAAYRVGARVVWRWMVDSGTRDGLPAPTLFALGEAIFAYIDELSAESVEGFAQEQLTVAGERQRLRRRLATLLLAGVDADAEPTARALAERAGWRIPEDVAMLVATAPAPAPAPDGDGEDDGAGATAQADRLAARLGPDVLPAVEGGRMLLVVPDPDAPGRAAQLTAGLRGRPAVLGPRVAWTDAARSARRALAALALDAAGSPARADQALVEIVLAADAEAAADLAAQRLAPLDTLTPASAERLAATLRAWLDQQGRIEATAAALAVHPQTVRYRLGQLRDLFGDALADPDAAVRVEPGAAHALAIAALCFPP